MTSLRQILIQAQKSIFLATIGNHTTTLKGDGYDFTELREYASGDDIRHIDWIMSAKLAKPYVKIFTQERELKIVIAPIMSASLYFGTQKLKQDLVSEICALLSYSCVQQNDPFESYFCDTHVKIGTPRSKSIDSVHDFIAKLHSFELLGQDVNYVSILKEMYLRLDQASMIFFIGDFFDVEEFALHTLSEKHEIVVIIVRDRFEENPQALGQISIRDPLLEKSTTIMLNAHNINEYTKELNKADTAFTQKLHHLGVRYVKIYTDEDPIEKIVSLLGRQNV